MMNGLLEGCDIATEEVAALQPNVIPKHALKQQQQQRQQQQLNLLEKQNDIGITKQQDGGVQMAKKAQLNQQEEDTIKLGRKKQRIIIFLAIEVWVDVFGFIKRIQLASRISLTNWHIYQICWPRLHGVKVRTHEVWRIDIGYQKALGLKPTAILHKDFNEMPLPIPECPPPEYISGFGQIKINFLDHQVLAFLALIAPRISKNKVKIQFAKKMSHLNENELTSVHQLLQIFREKMTTQIQSIHFTNGWSNIQFLPDVDNRMKRIEIGPKENKKKDIPILMALLASPRADGQQRVMKMHFWLEQLPVAQALLDSIEKAFRRSTQPAPQPFCLFLGPNFHVPQSEEQNAQTGETLTMTANHINYPVICEKALDLSNRSPLRGANFGAQNSRYQLSGHLDVCRHPRGQYAQWINDAMERLIDSPIKGSTTYIDV